MRFVFGDRFAHGLFHVQVFVVEEDLIPSLEQFLDKGTDTVGKLQGQADLEERYDSMKLFDESSGVVDGRQIQSYD